jgi:hypothetical protein
MVLKCLNITPEIFYYQKIQMHTKCIHETCITKSIIMNSLLLKYEIASIIYEREMFVIVNLSDKESTHRPTPVTLQAVSLVCKVGRSFSIVVIVRRVCLESW